MTEPDLGPAQSSLAPARESPPTGTRLAKPSRRAIAGMIEFLALNQPTLEITPELTLQIMNLLSPYPTSICKRAIVQLALSSEPWPSLGKLRAHLEMIDDEVRGVYPRRDDYTQPSKSTVARVSAALQLPDT